MKSHINWLSLGDRNISFFHMSTVIKRRTNKILKLLNSDQSWTLNLSKIEQTLTNHLKKFFTATSQAPASEKHTLSNLNFPKFNEINNNLLNQTPSELEIRKVVDSIGPLKIPGEDRLYAIFYQQKWEIVRSKLIYEIQIAFQTSSIPEDWGNTLICLIPKV